MGSGNEAITETDYQSGDGLLRFVRSYNSIDTTPTSLSQGWQHDFAGRSIRSIPSVIYQQLRITSIFGNPGDACSKGIAQISASLSGGSSLSASWNGSVCQISNGQTLQVYSTAAIFDLANPATVVDLAVQRPGGSLYEFFCNSSGCSTSSDVSFRLSTTGNGYRLIDEDDSVELYNSTGVLQSITRRGGYSLSFSYANGKLGTVTDSFGRALTLNYNPDGTLAQVTPPDQGVILFGYTGGRLASVTYPGQSGLTYTRQYQYSNAAHPFLLTGVIDEANNPFESVIYGDSAGRATASAMGGLGAGGLNVWQTSINYSDSANPVVTDAFGVARTYHFTTINGRQKLTSISGPPCQLCGAGQAQSYDSAGYYSSLTDWNGNLTQYTYDDSRGLELSRTEGAGTANSRTITTIWEPDYREPREIDEPGRTTVFAHDPTTGDLQSVTVTDTATQASRSWSYSDYTSFGQPQTIDGPRTDVADIAHIAYYPLDGACSYSGCPEGQIQTFTDALGHVTAFNSYDGSGRPTQITDANGTITKLSYTPRGWPQQLQTGTAALGYRTTTFAYWPTGQVKEIDYPIGAVRSFCYNAAHQLTDVYDRAVSGSCAPTAPAGHVHYTPDAMGNVTGIDVYDSSGAKVQTHQTQYNSLNQLYQDVGAYAGEVTQYSTYNDGTVKTVTDPLNHVTQFTLDTLNRIRQVTDPESKNTTYALNALDQLTAVQDPRGLQTSYGIDALGQLSQIVSPDSGTAKQTAFDGAGNVLSRVDAVGNTRRYQYDALNRLVQEQRYDINGALTDTITLTWDQTDSAHGAGIGRLTQISDSASGSTLNWSYDAWGGITQRSEAIGGVTLTTKWSYDTATGQLQSMTLPSKTVIGYTWNNGLITALSDNGGALVSDIEYFPFGGPTQWNLANGQTDIRGYDRDGRIDSDPVESISYDLASRVKGWTLASNSQAGDVRFGYQDPMDFVSSYDDGATSLGYQYDANGNRISATAGGVTASYTVDVNSNRLNSVTAGQTPTRYRYDANGSRTGRGLASYTYDAAGQMLTAGLGHYLYDGLGERIYKTVSRAVTLFAYDDSGHLIGQYNGFGYAPLETVYLGDIPVAAIQSGTAYYIHADYRNTPREIDDANKQVVWSWTPQPFGDNSPSGTFEYNLRYPGQYYDSESGLNYNYYRTYDPATGRYLESDPIGLVGGINTYAYVQGNPVSWIDPSGLDLTPVQQAAVTAAAEDWSNSNVPYVFGGATKQGADCSGAVSGIYNQAGINIGRLTSQQFKNSPLFSPVADAPQVGDIGVYPGHVDLYGGATGPGKDVWSASHTGGPVFGPAVSSWYGTPTWYRYNGGP